MALSRRAPMAPCRSLILFLASSCPSLGHRRVADLEERTEFGGTEILGTFTNLTNPGGIAETPWKNLLHNGKLMGEGAFGRATLYELQKPCEGNVVVKEILRGKKGDMVDELNTLHHLRGHPNVIRLYDYFPEEPAQWFNPLPLNIMSEVAYGGELDSAFFNQAGGWFGTTGRIFAYLSRSTQAKRREIKKKIVLMMLRDILAGLSYTHEKGYIHQDIKPANLWSASEGDSCVESVTCRYILGDFGLAVKPDKQGNVGGTFVRYSQNIGGTPAYMAPEQSRRLAVMFQTDVFSLGLSVAEIMSYPDDILKASSAEERLKILRKKEYYPPQLHELLEEMMSTHWNRRPSASDAHARVKRIIQAAYPEAPEPSAPKEPPCVGKCRKGRKHGGSCDPGKL